jgi:ketosteroid isomerase-like protein
MGDNAVEDFAEDFFNAICRADVAFLKKAYAPDALIWHNTDMTEKSAEASIGTIQWLIDNISNFRYEDARTIPTATGFVRLHICRGTHKSTGRELCVPVACIAEMKNGRITRFEEYFDASQGAADVPLTAGR